MYKVNRLDLGAWEGNLIFRGMLAWAFQEGVGGGHLSLFQSACSLLLENAVATCT